MDEAGRTRWAHMTPELKQITSEKLRVLIFKKSFYLFLLNSSLELLHWFLDYLQKIVRREEIEATSNLGMKMTSGGLRRGGPVSTSVFTHTPDNILIYLFLHFDFRRGHNLHFGTTPEKVLKQSMK